MKRMLALALLAAIGCSSAEERAPEREPAPADPAAQKDAQIQILRGRIAALRYDAAQADADLAKITSRREQLNAQPASTEKTQELAALAKTEEETKAKKLNAESELAKREADLRELSGQGQPKSADEALDLALATEAKKEKEAEEKKRIAAEQSLSEEKRRLAEAERARMAEEIRKSQEKIASAGAAGEAVFEERWADLILRVRVELQKYKRW